MAPLKPFCLAIVEQVGGVDGIVGAGVAEHAGLRLRRQDGAGEGRRARAVDVFVVAEEEQLVVDEWPAEIAAETHAAGFS